jgi:two-component system, NarL family, nitrate/nitrite response regulator NarL
MPSLDAAPAPVRIAIIEDHELLADALACALGRDGFDVVVVRPASFPAIIDHVRELSPGIVLLDLHLGDLGSSVSLIDPLREVGAEVICVTGETARATWGACVEAGASAVLSKSTPFDELVGRIGAVIAGEAGMPTSERVALLQDVREHRAEARVRLEPFQRLTVRECEVLRELMDGLSADAIAERAFVSLTTVRSHIRGILQKLGVSSQLAAVAMATRAGWSSPHRRPG